MTIAAQPPSQPQRVMFYLPVVTPWWFANIVIHLIRVMAREHEVHVLIPPLWRNTGLAQDQQDLMNELGHVHWHLLDGPDHPKLRTDASAEEDLFEFVNAIAPDLTLCRSADIATPARFPGTVRYIMEGAAPPIRIGPAWVVLSETLFDYGQLPSMSQAETERLDALARPLLAATAPRFDRNAWLEQHGLEPWQTVIGLPLEYEHEENFFGQHHRFASNAAMIEAVAVDLPDNSVLAVTNHPLNELYGNNEAIEATLRKHSENTVLLPSGNTAGETTEALAQHCDGMIVGNSKSWAAAAAYGTPILRLSTFRTGEWAQAYNDQNAFFSDIASGTAKTADHRMAQSWFTYHLLDAAFDPADPGLAASDIISRAHHPVASSRWVNALARYYATTQGKAA